MLGAGEAGRVVAGAHVLGTSCSLADGAVMVHGREWFQLCACVFTTKEHIHDVWCTRVSIYIAQSTNLKKARPKIVFEVVVAGIRASQFIHKGQRLQRSVTLTRHIFALTHTFVVRHFPASQPTHNQPRRPAWLELLDVICGSLCDCAQGLNKRLHLNVKRSHWCVALDAEFSARANHTVFGNLGGCIGHLA